LIVVIAAWDKLLAPIANFNEGISRQLVEGDFAKQRDMF
jgi:hypothetical protein